MEGETQDQGGKRGTPNAHTPKKQRQGGSKIDMPRAKRAHNASHARHHARTHARPRTRDNASYTTPSPRNSRLEFHEQNEHTKRATAARSNEPHDTRAARYAKAPHATQKPTRRAAKSKARRSRKPQKQKASRKSKSGPRVAISRQCQHGRGALTYASTRTQNRRKRKSASVFMQMAPARPLGAV